MKTIFVTMSTPLLCIQNLSVDFFSEDTIVHAVQHISFEIYHGKTLALVGESGSGKSVTALSLMGLLPVMKSVIRNGKILFSADGNQKLDLAGDGSSAIESVRGSKIGMIFQEPMTSLNPLMKCGRQVAETIMLHKGCSDEEAKAAAIQLFEEVKLPNPAAIYNRYPHELSGGQKQRVMIAIAISCDPLLLIADEPTTALDVTVQKAILELLKNLQEKRGMAILFITHDLNLVKYFADDVMIMYKSECIEYGETQAVFTNPQAAYTIGLLNCRPDKNKRVKFLKTVHESISEKSNSYVDGDEITEQVFNDRLNELNKRKVLLGLKDLHVWYPIKRNFLGKTMSWYKAVNGVDMNIHEGETMGLVGESGCGKTSIGKAIVGLVKPTNGEIIYKGKNVLDFSSSEMEVYRKEVQIIFQDPYSSLNPRITIGEAIREPMTVNGLYSFHHRKEKVIELLNKVGLQPDHYSRYPHEFSGGQRQRICIARALALQPSFIICDESVSALDVSVQAQILNLLVSLRDEMNLSYLFISHDLNVVKHISDRISVMYTGKMEETGNADSLYSHSSNQYTRQLIESSY